MKHVLFVCTGNTCRSPLAEALFRQLAEDVGLRVTVRSAGVAACPGCSASEYVQKILQEREIDGSRHQSQPVTREGIEWADLILTMTHGHRQLLIRQFPEAGEKTYPLKEFVLGHEMEELDRLAAELEMQRALYRQEQDPHKRAEREQEIDTLTQAFRACWQEAQARGAADIADPFGGDENTYRRCAEEIEGLLKEWICAWERTE